MKIPLLVVLSTSVCGASWAQTQTLPIQPSPLSQADIARIDRITDQTVDIKLKNVKPSLMAYWLDPAHHPLPVEFGGTGYPDPVNVPLLGGVFIPGTSPQIPTENQTRSKPLPQGIHWLGDIDSSKALVVIGSEEGIKQLTSIINLLDQPLRKVEVEARFVRLSENAAEELTPFQWPDGVIRVDSRFNSALKALRDRGSASISVAPSSVAFANTPAVLYSNSLSRPLFSSPDDRHLGAHFRLLDYSPKYTALVSAWRLEVTPTVSDDYTLTLLTHFNEAIWMDNEAPTSREQRERSRIGGLNVMVTVQDGETIAIKNAKAQSATASSDAAIVLLTAHIVKDDTK